MSFDPFLFFNDVENPAMVEPSDSEVVEIDLIKTTEDQLFEALEKTYTKDKLSKQQNFNAICLIQFNQTPQDKNERIFRIKARIPEIHTLIPNPIGQNDMAAIVLHPTFVGPIDILPNGPATVDNELVPGQKVVVTFENMDNFTEPKVVSIGPAPGAPAP